MATELTPTPPAAPTAAAAAPAPKPTAPVAAPRKRRTHPSLSRKNLIGLGITFFIGVVNLPSAFTPTPDGEEGPPIGVLVLDSICGLVMIAAVVAAWRVGSRAAIRVACGVNILQALSAVPAFFVDVPAGIKILVSVVVVLTFVSVVLSLSPGRRTAAVTD